MVERVEQLGDQLALVTVAGVPRRINVGLLDDGAFEVGSWVIIHMGFALEVVDESAADQAREGLELLGRADPGTGAADTRDRPDLDTN